MRRYATATALALIGALGCGLPAAAQQATAPPGASTLDVPQLFGGTCGWCHSDGGRAAGKGPQLMDSHRDDDYMRNRIKHGKEGAMPAKQTIGAKDQVVVSGLQRLRPGVEVTPKVVEMPTTAPMRNGVGQK